MPICTPKNVARVNATCLHTNRNAFVACNFKSRIETEALLKVTGSHATVKVVISRKRCQIKTLLQITSMKWRVAYQIAPFVMTLSDLQGHVLIAALIKYAFSNSCAAIDQISTHIAHCAVTMQ